MDTLRLNQTVRTPNGPGIFWHYLRTQEGLQAVVCHAKNTVPPDKLPHITMPGAPGKRYSRTHSGMVVAVYSPQEVTPA